MSPTKETLILTKTKINKEGHYIMVKGSMQQQESIIINIYAPNIGTPRYIRQVLNDLWGDLDSHTVIARDFTPHCLYSMDQQDRKLTGTFMIWSQTCNK